MKNVLVLLFLLASLRCTSQINFVGEIDTYYYTLNTLQTAGAKVQTWAGDTIKIKNLDLSPYRTIILPPAPGGFEYFLPPVYTFESTFDTDPSTIEVALSMMNTTTYDRGFRIVREDGNILFEDLEVGVQAIGETVSPILTISSDGVVHMLLGNYPNSSLEPYKTKIFTLPGTLPCFDCSTGGNVGVNTTERERVSLVVSPNPTNDLLNVTYTINGNMQKPLLQIVNSNGALIRMEKLNGTGRDTISTSDLAQGSYSCTLIDNGKILGSAQFIIAR
jgi:hypothetical protein